MSLNNFVRKIEGWMVGPDGDSEYCHRCWPIYIDQLPAKIRKVARQDGRPLTNREMAQARCKCADGWFVGCEICRAIVFEPMSPKPEGGG